MSMIEWLYGLQHFGIKLGLDNIHSLLQILDRPDAAYPSVLVAGTNGKGSVAAMIHSMLLASGVEAGMFTSPHLVRPGERIRVSRDDLSDVDLDRLLGRMRRRIETGLACGDLEAHPSFFEVMTATALETFRERRMQAAVLEVGLGGRLDATNAVDAAVAVVVSVDLDHTKSLGPTLERIAGEKAGVIKPGKPVVSGTVRQRAVDVLRRTAALRGAPFVDARVAVRFVSEDRGRLTFQTTRDRYPSIELGLDGRHQIDNARVALAAFELFADRLGIRPDPGAVREGLAGVRWPGRLQWIRDGRVGTDILLDGAHNPAGCEVLASHLRGLGAARPVTVFGAMHGKLLPAMLDTLAPVVGPLVITRPDVKRAADPEEVADLARRRIRPVEVVADPGRALRRAVALAGADRFVLVTGSLYLVGEILAALEGLAAPGPVSM